MKTAEERITEAVACIAGTQRDHIAESTARELLKILHGNPNRHTFGGVVFEETGEVRKAQRGEWWLTIDGNLCILEDRPTHVAHPILRPVAFECAE